MRKLALNIRISIFTGILYFLEAIAMTQHQLTEREVRIQKTQKMLKMGIHPYAQSFEKKDLIQDIIKQYSDKSLRESEEVVQNPQIQVKTAGRVMLYRSHGKLSDRKSGV